MTISDKLNKLKETKESIKEAIESKGVSVLNTDTFSSYADKIKNIQTGETIIPTGEWQPEPDWWDISKILEEDTEDCLSKIICLLSDELDDKSTINTVMGAYKYKLSDEQVLTATSTKSVDITDIFDTSKDKVCSKGYKTRYIIYYINDEVTSNIRLSNNVIYAIFSNVKFSGTSTFQEKRLLQLVKFNNTDFVGTSASSMFSNCTSLEEIELFDTSNIVNMGSMFSYCSSLKRVALFDTSSVTNMYRMFVNCSTLEEVPLFDTSNVTRTDYMFSSCFSLEKIPKFNIDNTQDVTRMFADCAKLKKAPLFNVSKAEKMELMFYGCKTLIELGGLNRIVSDINVTSSSFLNRITLLKILNALIDLTSQESKKITLGSTNLAKLTDEEKAIATNKNWTLA